MYKDGFSNDNNKLCEHALKDHEDNDEYIEWIRASKIPAFVDDEGDVHMFKDEYLDKEGELQQTEMDKDYQSGIEPNTTLSTAFAYYSRFV